MYKLSPAEGLTLRLSRGKQIPVFNKKIDSFFLEELSKNIQLCCYYGDKYCMTITVFHIVIVIYINTYIHLFCAVEFDFFYFFCIHSLIRH